MSGEVKIEKKVLDKGFVRLVDYMGNDSSIVQSARVSYGEGTKTVRDDAALIDYLLRHEHTSPFEMVVFKFHVKAPIFVARQWFRHRTGSYNEISGRYSVIKEEFFVPQKEDFRLQSKTNKQGSDEKTIDYSLAEKFLQEINELNEKIYNLYQEMLNAGVSREIARIILPLSTYTEFYFKQDLKNLLHFLKLRLDSNAQKEIRLYARAISEIIKEIVPITWSSFENHILEGKKFSKKEMYLIKKSLDTEILHIESENLSGGLRREFLEKLKG